MLAKIPDWIKMLLMVGSILVAITVFITDIEAQVKHAHYRIDGVEKGFEKQSEMLTEIIKVQATTAEQIKNNREDINK